MVKKYDLVILGGGSAGIVAGVMAGGLGMRVLLVEKHRMGGECLNTGCVPSKAIIHAAYTAHALRNAASVGLPSLPVSREDASGVMEWVRSSIDRVRIADATEQLLKDQGVTLMMGEPRFETPHRIVVGSEALRQPGALGGDTLRLSGALGGNTLRQAGAPGGNPLHQAGAPGGNNGRSPC